MTHPRYSPLTWLRRIVTARKTRRERRRRRAKK